MVSRQMGQTKDVRMELRVRVGSMDLSGEVVLRDSVLSNGREGIVADLVGEILKQALFLSLRKGRRELKNGEERLRAVERHY
ncbi:hypothetical protein TB2_039712 [Malus domestica]